MPRAITRALTSVALLLIGAFAGAFFQVNTNLIPRVLHPHHKTLKAAAKTYPALVVQPSGEWEYRRASLVARVRHDRYYQHLAILGYCIGQPTRNTAGVGDERWMILSDRLVMPAPTVRAALPLTLPLRACPGARGRIGGPTAITLRASAAHRELTLLAAAPHATTVAFAVFSRRRERWRTLALEQASVHGFLTRTPQRDAAVAMAVACWASGVLAQPAGPRNPLVELDALGRTPGRVYEDAASLATPGATQACSLRRYGNAVAQRPPPPARRAPRSPSSSNPSPSRPLEALSAPTADSTTPKRTSTPTSTVRRQTSARKPPESSTSVAPLSH